MVAVPLFKRIGGQGLFLLAIPVGTFCLGTWQVQRRKWKISLIKQLEEKMKAPVVEFPENLEDLSNLEYQKVKLVGHFDHDKEIYLGPRSLLVDNDASSSGSGFGRTSESGYLVITPFTLVSNGLTVLVNRGWVPRKKLNSSSRLQGQVDGTVKLTAVVRSGEQRAPFMPQNSSKSKLFSYRDLPLMALITGSNPVLLDAVESFEGGPVGNQTRVSLRNEHFSYIITWYSLSLITSYLWYRRIVLKKPLL